MLCSNTEIIWQEGVEKVPCSTILSQAINQFALIRIPLTLVCNRVRDVSHRDDSSDGYILGKWIMCQAHLQMHLLLANDKQTVAGREGGRGGKPPPDNWEGSCALPPVWTWHPDYLVQYSFILQKTV